MALLIIVNILSINEVVCSHNFHTFNEFGEEMFLAENCAHETFFWLETFLSQQASHHAFCVNAKSQSNAKNNLKLNLFYALCTVVVTHGYIRKVLLTVVFTSLLTHTRMCIFNGTRPALK